MVTSCRLDEDIIPEAEFPINTEGQTKLGKKLENPYTVENMRKAQENLRSDGQDNNLDVRTTHLYLRFKPRDEEELDLLKSDSTLILYSYPLDQEIEEGGNYYRDPEVPVGQPTYQYVAVNVDKKLPRLDYELLAKLYIPEEDESLNGRTSGNFSVNELVDEALRITNNLEGQTTEENENGRRASWWRPSGRFMIWDSTPTDSTTITTPVFDYWEYYPCEPGDVIEQKILLPEDPTQCKRAVYKYVTSKIPGKYVPLEGVDVRARRWFTTHRGKTGVEGYYQCSGEFKKDANYSFIWERYDFEIRNTIGITAEYNGPKKTGNWDLSIKDGPQQYHGTIFRAAHHYYYKNIKGLRRPPQKSVWETQLKIRAYFQNDPDGHLGYHNATRRFLGLGSAIKMYNPLRSSVGLYATTIHELAHASHWKMDKWHYNNGVDIVRESWARGVQWELTRMAYISYQPGYAGNYSGVVQDMIDGSSGYDLVFGYTIRQLEDALIGERYWNNSIKNKYNNGTENNLDEVFDHWN